MRRKNEKKPPAPARANAAMNGSLPRGYAAPIAVSTPAIRLGASFLDAGEPTLSPIHHLITGQGSAATQTSCGTAIDADLIIRRADLPTQAQANLLFILAGCAESRRGFTKGSFEDRGKKAAEGTK